MTDDYFDRKSYLERYGEHSARLQNWIGAYGAGLATLLVYQFRTGISDARALARTTPLYSSASDDILIQIGSMHRALAHSFWLIAVALGLQIVLLFLNKSSQFAIAHASGNEEGWSCFERLSDWFSGKLIFDALCDLVSVVTLAFATYYGIAALGLIV